MLAMSMENKGCTLFEGSRERSRVSIKGRLFEDYIDLRGGSMVYFVRGLSTQSGQYHIIVEVRVQ